MAREKPGYVTPVEIQKGIYYCIQNVGDILEDCNLLLENNRYTRALALSISALEEMGKISVLRSINRLPKNKQKLRSIEWNKFYEHQHKSSLGLFNTVRDEYKTTIDSIIFSASFVNEQAVLTEDLRQMALYTSYSASKKTWYSPREVDRETASRYFQTARAAFERIMQIRETGFFDANILQLEQQMYMEIYENLPDEPYDETTLRRISPLVKAKAKQLFDKLNEMGRYRRIRCILLGLITLGKVNIATQQLAGVDREIQNGTAVGTSAKQWRLSGATRQLSLALDCLMKKMR